MNTQEHYPEDARTILEIISDAKTAKSELLKQSIDENVKTYIAGLIVKYAEITCDIFKRFEKHYGYSYNNYRTWITCGLPANLELYTMPLKSISCTFDTMADMVIGMIADYRCRYDNMIEVDLIDCINNINTINLNPFAIEDTESARINIQTALWLEICKENCSIEDDWNALSESDKHKLVNIEYKDRLMTIGRRLKNFVISNGEDVE